MSLAAAAASAAVKVMIVGVFHMANPGHDLHNMKADDMLSLRRQGEIAAVTAALNRFHPTVEAQEWPAEVATKRYAAYLAGTLAPTANESVQLGFRLARTAGLREVHGIDVDGDFPYDAVAAYAKAHGQTPVLEAANATVEAKVNAEGQILARRGVSGLLRYLNDPAAIRADQGFYRDMLRIGAGDEQPGADLLTAWYHRNFVICARLVQLARPGDRIVVFYGAGHAFLLRQCVEETPGFELVEPNDYLPR
ncbi:MAG TPA: DUF5694 domain-containing protein [Caulobacteraceae bacterium]